MLSRRMPTGYLSRFHHAVVYRCLSDRIEIVGVMHDRRDPVRWKNRTSE
jgi:hypothetical protein